MLKNCNYLTNTLEWINLEILSNISEYNAASKIYSDLYQSINIQYQKDANKFLNDYPQIKSYITELLTHVRSHPKYLETSVEQRRKLGCLLLGQRLGELMPGRFQHEKPKNLNHSNKEHSINWFKENHNLIYETDKELVQAGAICIFVHVQDFE